MLTFVEQLTTQKNNIMKNSTSKLITNQDGTISKSITNMLKNCRFYNNKIYTGYHSGSGRFTTAHSALTTVTNILNAQGYKYKVSNDAPKGGIRGEHLIVSKVAFNFLETIKNSN